jgi:hypothetical protein
MVPAVVMAVCGCSQDPYAAVLAERLETQRETVRILKTIQDQASMAAAQQTLLQNYRRYDEIAGRVSTMHKPTGDALRQLEKDWGSKMEQVVQETQKELIRINQLPGGVEFLAALDRLK